MSIIRPLDIGNVQLKNNVILAPMAGVCDLPFRVLCANEGVGMTCTEMVSAKAIFYNNKNTYDLMRIDEREPVVSLQLFGSDPTCISDMAKRIEDEGIRFDVLDINMGCPVPKVVNNGDGSALMKNPKLAARIMEETANAISKPVTAKIRIGFDEEHLNGVEMAHVLEEAGAAAIAVHGRTREQFYSGEANWDIIGEIKSRAKIPIIGNGDLTCYQDLVEMYNQTGCDGFMIGRAARGNPWIFSNILAQDKSECDINISQKETKPSWDEVKKMMLLHGQMLVEHKGEYIGVREMRKHAGWYTAGFPHSSKFRGLINQVESLDALEELINNIG